MTVHARMNASDSVKTLRSDSRDISIVNELMYQLMVRDVMTRDVYTVAAEDSLRDVQHLMRDRKISGVPVVENDRLVGIVSLDDIIRALDNGEIEKPVGEKMTRSVRTVQDHVSAVKAIDEMEKTGFGRLPVLDRDGRVVGIITHWDVVRKLLVMLQDVALEAEARERSHSVVADSTPPDEEEVTTLDFIVDKDDFENAGRASSAVKKQLQARGVDPAVIRRVAVAMYEAEMNIIIHSLGGRMKAQVYPDRIAVAAQDRGPGIADIDLAMREGYSTASEKVREMGFGAGMGLANIKRCADAFELHSQVGSPTRLMFSVRFHP
jgi:CBS domain-containing protein/anti-sigma regulatory factor (Ser/Thr protein kinase)